MSNVDHQTGRLPPRSRLQDRYIINRLIDRGAMAAVYEAVDTRARNLRVAIKEMSQSGQSEEELATITTQFQQEATILRSLDHPKLPRFYDSFEADGRYYLVMQFIEGETLLKILNRLGGQPLSVEKVLDYALQLCDVLSYLHQRRPPVIFRDLKPSNVMVTQAGQLFLIDFGIARIFKEGQGLDTVRFMTPAYAPPELINDTSQSSPASDLYSLGATLHHCLTAQAPKRVDARVEFLPVRTFNKQVPLKLDELIQWLIQPNPYRRPHRANEVQKNLQEIQQEVFGATHYPTSPASAQPLSPTQAAGPRNTDQRPFYLGQPPPGSPADFNSARTTPSQQSGYYLSPGEGASPSAPVNQGQVPFYIGQPPIGSSPNFNNSETINAHQAGNTPPPVSKDVGQGQLPTDLPQTLQSTGTIPTYQADYYLSPGEGAPPPVSEVQVQGRLYLPVDPSGAFYSEPTEQYNTRYDPPKAGSFQVSQNPFLAPSVPPAPVGPSAAAVAAGKALGWAANFLFAIRNSFASLVTPRADKSAVGAINRPLHQPGVKPHSREHEDESRDGRNEKKQAYQASNQAARVSHRVRDDDEEDNAGDNKSGPSALSGRITFPWTTRDITLICSVLAIVAACIGAYFGFHLSASYVEFVLALLLVFLAFFSSIGMNKLRAQRLLIALGSIVLLACGFLYATPDMQHLQNAFSMWIDPHLSAFFLSYPLAIGLVFAALILIVHLVLLCRWALLGQSLREQGFSWVDRIALLGIVFGCVWIQQKEAASPNIPLSLDYLPTVLAFNNIFALLLITGTLAVALMCLVTWLRDPGPPTPDMSQPLPELHAPWLERPTLAVDRITYSWIVGTCLLLLWAFGNISPVLSAVWNLQWLTQSENPQDAITISRVFMLLIAGLFFFSLLKPARPLRWGARITALITIVAFLLLSLSGEEMQHLPVSSSFAPLLSLDVAVLDRLFAGTLLIAAIFSMGWLRRPFSRKPLRRVVLGLVFVLAGACALYEVFLAHGEDALPLLMTLITLILGVLIATQIERVRYRGR